MGKPIAFPHPHPLLHLAETSPTLPSSNDLILIMMIFHYCFPLHFFQHNYLPYSFYYAEQWTLCPTSLGGMVLSALPMIHSLL